METYLTCKGILEYLKLYNIEYTTYKNDRICIIYYDNKIFDTTIEDLRKVSYVHPKYYPEMLVTHTTRKLYKYIIEQREKDVTMKGFLFAQEYGRQGRIKDIDSTFHDTAIKILENRTKDLTPSHYLFTYGGTQNSKVIVYTYHKRLEQFEKDCKAALEYYNCNTLKEVLNFANKDKKEKAYFKAYNGNSNLTKNVTIQASKASMQHSIYEYINKISYTDDTENISKILDTTLLDELVTYAKNPFPIKEVKQQKETIMKNTIEKLKKLRDENPALADAIEKEFPEIIDNEPYVYSGALFMKKQYDSNIYEVLLQDDYFVIRNIKDNKHWSGKQNTSNPKNDYNKRYLTKKDFIKLLSQSSVSPDYVAFIDREHLQNLHTELFNK
jgi:hypothetical protein